jgi:integrase
VASISKALTSAARRAGLDGRVSAYSIRHSVARYLETAGVPEREISIQLGHERVSMKRTTRRYAAINPLAPTYLAQATAAIESYVRLIDGLTERNLLTPSLWRQNGASN